MKPLTYSFSNLKVARLSTELDGVITSFDYRISLIDEGKGAYRYGVAELAISLIDTELFIPFQEVQESAMIAFLRQSLNDKFDEIEQEMRGEIVASAILSNSQLPWESEETQGD
jgi:hypothetical protein